ncbi:MAG: extracellular solute-binding protein [Planctomycetota bacterium]
MRTLPTALSTTLTSLLLLSLASCGGNAAGASAGDPVSVYCALDQEFSEPVLKHLAKQLGVELKLRFDSEVNKTVGLVSALVEEKATPRCSVFWNNELANTVSLAQKGVLAAYDSPSAQDIPQQWRDPEHRWTGFAARARILIVNTKLIPDPKDWPSSYLDLADPKWKGKCAIALPKTGTTLTHFTALQKVIGDEALGKWIDDMQKNDVAFLGSNGATMRAVREGTMAFAFTDTDDFHTAKLKGFDVACVFPDQGEGQIGTMLIPNAVGLVQGGPNQDAAKKLIDAILSRQTEALLAAADSAQIPLREGVAGPKDAEIKKLGEFRQMAWDPTWTGGHIDTFQREYGKRLGL